MIILAGNSNPALAAATARRLNTPLAQVEISQFPNGEKRIWVKSEVKDTTVAIVQSFSNPVDEHIIEFTLLVDAVHNLGARRIIAVVPWLGYSPQDKEFRKGEPVSVQVIAKIIEAVGVDELITVDIHSHQSLNHFTIPTQELSALPLFIDYWQDRVTPEFVAIALDKGSYTSAQVLGEKLHIPLAIFHKTRDLHTGQVQLEFIQGEVAGKHGLSVDDFVSTGATRIAASKILKDRGLLSYHDCITHAILANDTAAKLQDSPIDSIIVTDTYPLPDSKRIPKLTVLSAAPVLARALAQTSTTSDDTAAAAK